MIPVRDFDERFLVMATSKGVVKKTALAAYGNPRRGGITAMNLDKGDTLIGVRLTGGNDEIVLGTRNGMAIRFSEKQLRSMGRATRGVRGVHLRKGDSVVDINTVDRGATLLAVCENGYGKRTDFDEYPRQNRGGYGVINIRTTRRNGKVVALRDVFDSDELMVITHHGMIIRTPVKPIRTIGRATQGVRLINLKEGDKVVAVARIGERDDDEDTERETPESAKADGAGKEDKPEPARGASEAKSAKKKRKRKTKAKKKPSKGRAKK
jgi:DNA gyrase subunit A